MRKTTIPTHEKLSVSVSALAGRQAEHLGHSPAAYAAGVITFGDSPTVDDETQVATLVEVADAMQFMESLPETGFKEIAVLAENFATVVGTPRAVANLAERADVFRVQTKKEKDVLLDAVPVEIGLQSPGDGTRAVAEAGDGVLVGIVDSGLDLSHPAFRDSQGNLRVEALFDQTAGKTYQTTELEHAWAAGQAYGDDMSGHGTHVASIAGGSKTPACAEGVAPRSRLLLVKTDMLRTDDAVAWVFARAEELGRPCVVNLSLGHHFGPHDGSDAEERLFARLTTEPGRVIVVAGGNEREDAIHAGGYFHAGQTEELELDLLRQIKQAPGATVTFWYDYRDTFAFELVTPAGQALPFPALNAIDEYSSSRLTLELSVKQYVWSSSTYAQAAIGIKDITAPGEDLRGWTLRVSCKNAFVGRLDGWVNNSHCGEFRQHHLLDRSGTIGLPGTGDGTITVASYVSKNAWQSDAGAESDRRAVVGRSSAFSSLGPTRDGRWKPDIAAPGQYVTAALSQHSPMNGLEERALVNSRTVTIEGTSMAAPVVTGIVALLLQKKPSATARRIADVLRRSARHDHHTGPAPWNTAYGYGKIDVAKALQMI